MRVKTSNHQVEQTGADHGKLFTGFRFPGSLGVRAPVAHLDRWVAGSSVRTAIPFFALLIFAGCDPMPSKVTVHSERVSPDGRYVATAFDRDSGATTSWSAQVDLRPAGQAMDKYGDVFRGYGSPSIDVEWLSSSNLVIYFDTNCEVDLYSAKYYGIAVELKHRK